MNVQETLLPKLTKIIELVVVAEGKSEGYLNNNNNLPEITYELLMILNLSDDLVEIFNPTKQPAEYFGMPKEALINANEAKEITSDQGVDFTPWFAEKITYIKLGVKRAIMYWEMDIESLQLSEDAPMTKEEYVSEGLLSGLHQVKVYAETVQETLNGNDESR